MPAFQFRHSGHRKLCGAAEIVRVEGKRKRSVLTERPAFFPFFRATALGHGNWLSWLDREFGWTDDTALNFMRVHSMIDKNRNFRDLSLPVSGLYLLAAPSTPEEAREAVIEAAADDGKLTHAPCIEVQISKTRHFTCY
jgi:hypothetical protein